MNDKNDSVSAPGENSDLQPVDGETTPPTDYDGITTPPTSSDRPKSENLTDATHGTAAQSASTKSPLNIVIIALVAAIVITLGVIGYLVLSGEDDDGAAAAPEPEPITGQPTTINEETGVETAEEGPFDPFSSVNESDYSDHNSEPAAWISPAQGVIFHSGGLDQVSAFEVREAFIDRIIELAEDPATPDQMPSTITSVNAGGLGEFTCRVDMAKEFNEYWECRGPDTRQVVFSPIIEGGIPNTGDSTLHMIQQGTPHDQDWKQRALTYKSN